MGKVYISKVILGVLQGWCVKRKIWVRPAEATRFRDEEQAEDYETQIWGNYDGGRRIRPVEETK